jgi:tetratricopeptide (TPR) repeat protein
MTDLGRWLPTAFSVLTAVALVQNVAVAKSAPEINQIAQAITVRIAVGQGNGSGILLQKDGDVYTVLTAAHVVKKATNRRLTIVTADDIEYQPIEVRRYQGDVDLAIVKFRSASSYRLAELGDSNSLIGGMNIYAAGFPASTRVINQPVFVFLPGQVVANSKRLFEEGYGLLYDNKTLPGMSGGPILDEAGKVVAIHGKGDRELDTGNENGIKAGIPIARFADIASGLGVGTTVARTVQSPILTADDYFLSAYQKYEKKYYRGALADYNQSIALKPDYANAYVGRGNLKYEKLNDVKGALADYNQSIALKPDNASAYVGRGILKVNKLNDVKGALADYNQSIALKPDNALAYNNRGILKVNKLNDVKGALADFNQSIAFKPDYAEAYNNRGNLKVDKLNDVKGALADYNQSIALKPDFADAYYNRGNLKYEKLNDVKGALADYNQSIALKPDFASAYNNRGILKVDKLNDVKGALADYNQSIALKPDFADAYNNRGLLKYEKLNDVKRALADYNQSIALNPDYALAYKNRGNLKKNKLNDVQGAITDYRKSEQLYRQQGKAQDADQIKIYLSSLEA